MNINIYESVEYLLKAKEIVVKYDTCNCELKKSLKKLKKETMLIIHKKSYNQFVFLN